MAVHHNNVLANNHFRKVSRCRRDGRNIETKGGWERREAAGSGSAKDACKEGVWSDTTWDDLLSALGD